MEMPIFNQATITEKQNMGKAKDKDRVFVAVHYLEDQMAVGLPHIDPSLKEHFHFSIYVESKDRSASISYDINPVRKLLVKSVKDLSITSRNEPIEAEASGSKLTEITNITRNEAAISEIFGGNGGYHPHLTSSSSFGHTLGYDASVNKDKGKSIESELGDISLSVQNNQEPGSKKFSDKQRAGLQSPGASPGKKCIEWDYFYGGNEIRSERICLGMWMIGKLPAQVTPGMVADVLGQLPVLPAGDPLEDWEGLKSACAWWTKQAIRVLQEAGWADEFDVDDFVTFAFAYAVEWKLRRMHKMLLITDYKWEPERKCYVKRRFP